MIKIILTILIFKIVFNLNNGLGLVPPMGWNSWNKFACNINETLIIQTANAMVDLGFRDVGYEYLNIDDCWALKRNSQKKIEPDPATFPSGMLYISKYLHSKSLKFGIYSDAGLKTCAGRPGSLFHEVEDANTYAQWQVDYLKYDNCYSAWIAQQYRYIRMRDALNATNRKIYFSMCEWGFFYPWKWASDIANSWRINLDIKPIWIWIQVIIEQLLAISHLGKPGAWNDPDMLQVGIGHLSQQQQKTHFAIWAITKSPLIIGCDLNNLRQTSKNILLNREIITLNQDKLGIPGKLVKTNSFWLRIVYMPLENGDMAVLLYNRGNRVRTGKFEFSEVNWPFNQALIRDLYEHNELGKFENVYSCQIPIHGVKVFRLSRI